MALNTLRSIPFAGKLRWYQLTPAPRAACPNCGGFVRHTAHNSPWLYLAVVSFILGLLSLLVPTLAFLSRGYYLGVVFIPAIVGVLLALKAGRLAPVVPPASDAT